MRVFSIVILMSLVLSQTLTYSSTPFITLEIDNEPISREKGQVEVIDGTAYISFRFLKPALQMQIEWEEDLQQVKLTKNEKQILLDLNQNTLTLDGVTPQSHAIINKRADILLPLRLVGEYLGYQINFEPKGPIISMIDGKLLKQVPDLSLNQKKQEETSHKKEIPKKVMYLTFDDGPSPYTAELLDLLKEYNMKATFFMLDAEMKQNEAIVKRIVEEGHGVGLHGVSHEKDIFYCGNNGPLKEMEKANQTLESIVGFKTCIVRTPYGSSPYLTKNQYMALCSHDYRIWDWNIDSRDWAYRNAERTFYATIKMIKTTQHEPKVVLFHDIKQVIQTMKLFLRWMEENQYTSDAITPDLVPVKMN
ncbi:polysaccharide deacetylase family protein [Sporanaerobium hydrogeniformans]|uniref:polysaccharide deacetylase family protein n=1 Tax=Sporanaerobium hydrogeniformans TaxID=3072179 RepID=UPI0027E551A1|nr:polysaccharide deacetylase family protein [Sporanaerobium hydrogeniformans]